MAAPIACASTEDLPDLGPERAHHEAAYTSPRLDLGGWPGNAGAAVPENVDVRAHPMPRARTALASATPRMSSALHPRDKSFIGAASPCRSGPSARAPPNRSVSL